MRSFAVVMLLATVCHAYKKGPPPSVCGTMMPSHNGMAAQSSNTFADMYTFTSDFSCFKENSTITVTLAKNSTANETIFFEGFFVQARKVNLEDNSYGIFDKADSYPPEFANNVQTIDCFEGSKNAIGHKGAEHQVNAPLTWVAPEGLREDIEFVATVVFHKNTFWVKEKLSLKYCGAPDPSGSGRLSAITGLMAAAIMAMLF